MSAARRWMGLVAMAALAVAFAACGGTPTQPAPPAGTVQVAGSWSGTWTFTVAGLMATDDVTMTLSQNGATVTGTWAGTSGASGQVNFGAMAAVTGTLTINQPTLGGGSCNASTMIQGTADPNRLELNLANIPAQGICQWGTEGRVVVTR